MTERLLREYLWNAELWKQDIWDQTFYSPNEGLVYRIRGAYARLDKTYFAFWRRLRIRTFTCVRMAEQKRGRQGTFIDVDFIGGDSPRCQGILKMFEHLDDGLAGAVEYAASKQKVQCMITECEAKQDMTETIVRGIVGVND